MKICVIALYYSRNFGDAVIGDCVRAKIQEAFPDAEIVVRDLYGRDSFGVPSSLKMKTVRRRKYKEKVRFLATRFSPLDKEWDHEIYMIRTLAPKLKKYFEEGFDAAVFAGGQIFADTLSMEVTFLADGFAKRGIPVFFNACGTGSMYCKPITKEMSRALHAPQVKMITVRDHPENVKRAYKVNAVQVFDPALYAAELYPADNKYHFPPGTVGLGVMYPYSLSEKKTIRFWNRLIQYLEKQGTPWKIFTNGADMDLAFAKEILRTLGISCGEEADKRILHPADPEDLTKIIRSFDGIISFRLHSHILAASYEVPAAAIVWDDKVREFYHLCKLKNRCFTIYDRPETILRGLRNAETEGWPVRRIQKGKTHSLKLLTDRMREVLY